jgi:hypothetical protein
VRRIDDEVGEATVAVIHAVSASLTCISGKMRCSSGDRSNVLAAAIAAVSSPSPVVNRTESCRLIRLVISQ